MNFAPTYASAIVGILSVVLPLLKINIAPEALMTTVTTLSLLFIAIRQVLTGRSTVLGSRPQ